MLDSVRYDIAFVAVLRVAWESKVHSLSSKATEEER